MDILENEPGPEAMWGLPGQNYDGISFGLSDTISHAVQILWPRQGEDVLDIGTGTGWAARLAAGRGARVIGVDIAPGMLAAADALSGGLVPQPEYVRASAEALPFRDASFDGVVSTYGVIFAADPSAAIAEMSRVLRPGGRVALATWADAPDGYIDRFFNLISEWSGAPPPPSSPLNWGRPQWLADTMAGKFRISCRPQTTTLYAPDASTVWDEYLRGFGPVAAVFEALSDTDREAFRAAFEDLHREYQTEMGLVIPRQALLLRAVRV